MRKDKNWLDKNVISWYNTVIGCFSNKRVEFKLMREIKPDYYLSMSEMISELNAKIPAEPKNISLHLDGFDIRYPTSLLWLCIMEHQLKCRDQTWLFEWDSNKMKFCAGLHPLYLYPRL